MDEPQLPSSDNDPDTYFVNMVVDDIEQGSDILSQDSLANNAINNANNAINNAINNGNNPNNPNNNIFDTISETTATIAKYTNRVINGTIDEVKEIASGTKNNPKTSFFSGWTIPKILLIVLMALCALGLIIAVLYFLLRKKPGKTKGTIKEVDPKISERTATGKALVGTTDAEVRKSGARNV